MSLLKRMALATLGAMMFAGGAQAQTCDWPLWQNYAKRFVQDDGRVLNSSMKPTESSSEGQSYAMFFALVGNDRASFDKLWTWTKANMSGSDIGQNLPGWLWGKKADNTWGVIDQNSASDADLWMAYALLEAARVWNAPQYRADAQLLLANVERNLIVDAARGIALGLGARAFDHPRGGERLLDHAGGTIRQNVVVNRHAWADEGIEANAAAGVRIEHNTVVVDGRNPWAIGIRFAVAAATVRNNLTSQPIVERTGGRAVLHGNVTGARPDWFVDLPAFDLHLARHTAAIDAGVMIDGIATDFDRQPRRAGLAPDAGAYEYRGPARGGGR